MRQTLQRRAEVEDNKNPIGFQKEEGVNWGKGCKNSKYMITIHLIFPYQI